MNHENEYYDNMVTMLELIWGEVRREYELIKGDLYNKMVELLGKMDADHFVEDWRAMAVVCESGELLQGYCRGRRPG